MAIWEYCEVEFDGTLSYAWFYDEAGQYIDNPRKHARLGILLAQLGHDGWELVSTSVRPKTEFAYQVTSNIIYMFKRLVTQEWTQADRDQAQQVYFQKHPQDRKFK